MINFIWLTLAYIIGSLFTFAMFSSSSRRKSIEIEKLQIENRNLLTVTQQTLMNLDMKSKQLTVMILRQIADKLEDEFKKIAQEICDEHLNQKKDEKKV